jgi:hypothetical protein
VNRDGGHTAVKPGSELKAAYGARATSRQAITGPVCSPEAAPELSKEALAH